MLIFLLIFFIQRAELWKFEPTEFIEASELKLRLESELVGSWNFLNLDIILHMNQILELDDPNHSALGFEINLSGERNQLRAKFTDFYQFLYRIKKSQFKKLLSLLWTAFDYVNKLILELKTEYINNQNPDCTLEDLTNLLNRYPQFISAYRFSYYSLLYTSYIQLIFKERVIIAHPHVFAFSGLAGQVVIVLLHLFRNFESGKNRKRARKIFLFLEQLIEVRFKYESRIALLLSPSPRSIIYSSKAMNNYRRRKACFKKLLATTHANKK
jgi:hypothetical protein